MSALEMYIIIIKKNATLIGKYKACSNFRVKPFLKPTKQLNGDKRTCTYLNILNIRQNTTATG